MARRNAWIWMASCAAVTVLAVVCGHTLDRPVALAMDSAIRPTGLWAPMVSTLKAFDLTLPFAIAILVTMSVRSGRSLSPAMVTVLACSWACVLAFGVEETLKVVFGRGAPDPTYLRENLYGFWLLHGRPRWNSFPSGTATIACAIAAVVWRHRSRWRTVVALLAVLLCIAAVLTNSHWISDVLVGAWVGVAVAAITLRLLQATPEKAA